MGLSFWLAVLLPFCVRLLLIVFILWMLLTCFGLWLFALTGLSCVLLVLAGGLLMLSSGLLLVVRGGSRLFGQIFRVLHCVEELWRSENRLATLRRLNFSSFPMQQHVFQKQAFKPKVVPTLGDDRSHPPWHGRGSMMKCLISPIG